MAIFALCQSTKVLCRPGQLEVRAANGLSFPSFGGERPEPTSACSGVARQRARGNGLGQDARMAVTRMTRGRQVTRSANVGLTEGWVMVDEWWSEKNRLLACACITSLYVRFPPM